MNKMLPIEVNNLTKVFRKFLNPGFKAVDAISFSMVQGEILGFLGPNGAGKTTAIKCILGLLFPTSGKTVILGSSPASRLVRNRIGYIPENPDYEDAFTPMEFLRAYSSMRNLNMPEREMHHLLERVGIPGWENTRIRNFSKGMRQRLSLALALQSKPDLYILDEPTGGLDPLARKEFRDIILEERDRGASVFLSSHLLSEVETICDRAIILSKGKKVAEGSLQELLTTDNKFRIEFSRPEQSEKEELIVDEQQLQSTIDTLRKERAEISIIHPIYNSLEEIFLSVTGGEK